MEGTILWFNLVKDLGLIATEEGDRFPLLGTAFADGERPTERCTGAGVTFRVELRGDERRAEDVRFVTEVAPRRARMRSGRMRSSW